MVEISGLPRVSFPVDYDTRDRWSFRLSYANTVRTSVVNGDQRTITMEAKLFPGQEALFPAADITFKVPTHTDVRQLSLNWSLYLEDSPTLSGKVALGERLNSASEDHSQPERESA